MVGFLQYYITMVFAFCVNLVAQCSGNDILYSQNNYNNLKGVKEIKRTDYHFLKKSYLFHISNIYFNKQGSITKIVGHEPDFNLTYFKRIDNFCHHIDFDQYGTHPNQVEPHKREILMAKTVNSYYSFSFDTAYNYKNYSVKTFDSLKRLTSDVFILPNGDTAEWISHLYDVDTELVIIRNYSYTPSSIDTMRITTLSRNKDDYPLKTFSESSPYIPFLFYSNYSYTYY